MSLKKIDIINVLISLFSTISLVQIFAKNNVFGIIICLFIFVCIFFSSKYFLFVDTKNIYGKRSKYWVLFSFLFITLYFLGIVLESKEFLDRITVVNILIAGFGVAIVIAFLIAILAKYLNNITKKLTIPKYVGKNKSEIKVFFIYASVIFLLFLPVFLAFYPGIFGYDAREQIKDLPITTHHPFLHTLYLKFFYYTVGNFLTREVALSIATILQMAVYSMALAYVMLFLYRVGLNKVLQIISLIIIALIPYNSVLSISATKDVFFTAFFITFILPILYFLMDESWQKNRKMWLLFFISSIMICLLRNNAIITVVVAIVVGILVFKRKFRCQFTLIASFALIVFFILNTTLMAVFNVIKSPAKNEAFSMPIVQVSRAYMYEKEAMNEKNVAEINRLIPRAENYAPQLADNVKGNLVTGVGCYVGENKKDFFKLYFSLLKNHKTKFVEGFLYLTKGYWFINDKSMANIYGANNSKLGYLLIFNYDQLEIKDESKFPKLEKLYRSLFANNTYFKIPILPIFLAPAFYFWLVVFALFLSYIKGVKGRSLIALVLFSYIGTLFLGPCVLIRYALPYIVISVPYILFAFIGKKNEKYFNRKYK